MPHDNGFEENLPEPTNLRFLRILVTVLTGVMIVGVMGILVVLFLRLSKVDPVAVPLDDIALPAGITAVSVSYTPNHILVVGGDDMLYLYRADGSFDKAIPLTSSAANH
ncbi:MAG: DUF6476 family protein [Planktomarina sp.]